jgi:hypothetical protein
MGRVKLLNETTGRISLPKRLKVAGLFIRCNTCKRNWSNDSKIECTHTTLQYRARVHLPGTINKVAQKALAARNVHEAINELFQFKAQLFNINYKKPEESKFDEPKDNYLLKDCNQD